MGGEYHFGVSRGQAFGLISRFPAVPDGEKHDFFSVVPIKGYVSALSELDDPLAEFFGQVFDGSAYFRVAGEDLYSTADRGNGAPGGIAVLRREEIIKSGDIA